MKKDKEWLKEQIERLSYTPKGLDENSSIISKNWVLAFINQLDEPEKPVIPQLVADWIEEDNLYSNNPLREFLDLENDFNEGWTDEEDASVYHWINENPYAFIDALRYGHEVEKEKKYRVIDRHKVYLLAKEERNKVETVAKLVEIYGHDHVELTYQLTEQEIKDYDERFWPFAVKVEELEE